MQTWALLLPVSTPTSPYVWHPPDPDCAVLCLYGAWSGAWWGVVTEPSSLSNLRARYPVISTRRMSQEHHPPRWLPSLATRFPVPQGTGTVVTAAQISPLLCSKRCLLGAPCVLQSWSLRSPTAGEAPSEWPPRFSARITCSSLSPYQPSNLPAHSHGP